MRYSLSYNSLPGTRKINQDRVGYTQRDDALLMVVADGLGGYAGGELAAQTVVETMIDSFENTKASFIADPAAFLVLSISYAHTMINRRAKSAGIGVSLPRSTCVACLVQNGYAYWGHVGDSRLYHIRDGVVVTRTVDDSTMDQMYNNGEIDESELKLGQGQLLRCVGGPKRPEITLGRETRLDTGDVLLLCSDGVWRASRDRDLIKAVNQDQTEDGVEQLLTRAERKFRRDCDNITAMLFRWEDAVTDSAPLHNLATPQLDQRSLWRDTRKRQLEKTQDGPAPLKPTAPALHPAGSDIETTIAEIESFIQSMEDI